MNDFNIEPLSATLNKLGISEVQWRRNLIKQITGGDVYDYKEGFITIEAPAAGFCKDIYSSNVSIRLDGIIHQLLNGGDNIETWIENLIKEKGRAFTLEEVKQLKITVSKGNSKIKEEIAIILQQFPKEKVRGGFEIKFPNGKIYYSTSKDIKTQVRKHLNGIFNKPTLSWHSTAAIDNPDLKPLDLKIIWYPITEEKYRKVWKDQYDETAATNKENFYN